ncbi:L,D-transpeptidase family protein [Albidovulum sp.]|uniref:L,D-transpeptidase family protein n=1 Tax=Albidovulum sp. TaxID=1872424 RepID=UPI0039B84A0A
MTSMSRHAAWATLAASAALSALVSATPLAALTPADLAFRQAVAEQSAETDAVAAFYRERDFAPLWTTAADAGRRQALFAALDGAADHGLPAVRYDAGALRENFRTVRSERERGQLEVAATRAFLAYAQDVRTGFINPASIDAGLVREVPVRDPLATLRSFAAAGDPGVFVRALPPQGADYAALRRGMLDLRQVIAAGGWGPAVGRAALKPGEAGPAVVALRDRMIRMGYLGGSVAPDYDAALQKAVQRFQIDHGLSPDGVAGEGTVAEINVAPEARLASVLVAMERLRWMNGVPLGRRHIWVNLPDFTAKIVDDGKVMFETVTVVGMNQSDRRSPEFSDQMEFMVVNPTWNVPRSITVKEYLPMLQKNPRAVSHLKIVDRRGRVVNREATDFTQFTAKNFPFSISQPPSDDNALGLVKFMFPNKWNIYLHDTPSKSLFGKEVRAFSHGCIRLGKPFDFAYALLARQTDDPVGLFEQHLKTRAETTIMLDQPVPVHLVYFTAWPDARGQIEYRRDVYGRDARIFEEMQAAGVVLDAVQG